MVILESPLVYIINKSLDGSSVIPCDILALQNIKGVSVIKIQKFLTPSKMLLLVRFDSKHPK